MTPADRAWELLADGLTPQQIIARLTPATKAEAIQAARRLPLLAERPDADRGAAIARIAARIGMRRFHLFFTPDGRVADRPAYNAPSPHPAERTLPGDGCAVTYTARYYGDKDHFQFTGEPTGEPDKWGVVCRRPIPFSGSGYWSLFADPDAVMALGGPEAYLAAVTAAGMVGKEEFERAFSGREPEPVRKPRRPVVGEHTAKVAEPVRETPRPPVIEPPDEEPNLFTRAEEPGRDR